MARAARLFRLLDALRRLPAPVTAARLAEETGVSVRSLYRDIAALRASGARIEGAAGYGYTLAEDPALPPQSLTRLEVDALALAVSSLRFTADAQTAQAGEEALAKIVARLPEARQREAAHSVLTAYRHDLPARATIDMAVIRDACWDETALDLVYADVEGRRSERRVWPLCIAYLERALILVALCRMRGAFRRFRLDRIIEARPTEESFRPRRAALLRDCRAEMQAEKLTQITPPVAQDAA